MKVLKNVFLFLMLSLVVVSCSKDENTPEQAQPDLASRAVGDYVGYFFDDSQDLVIGGTYEFSIAKVDNTTIRITGEHMTGYTVKVMQHPTLPERLDAPENFETSTDTENYIWYYDDLEKFTLFSTGDEVVSFYGNKVQ